MAYTTAKEICTAMDLARFACCFLNAKDVASGIDWDAAAAEFDPTVKVASFKTVTMRAVKKIKEAEGAKGDCNGMGDGKGDGGEEGKKGGARKKRKESADKGEDTTPSKKKAKKGKKDVCADADDDIMVKQEDGAVDEDDFA